MLTANNKIESGEKIPIEPVLTSENLSYLKPDIRKFEWIENDGLLRDEGVLFGIAGSNPDEKISAIKSYYKLKSALPESQLEALNKRRLENEERINVFLEKINEKSLELQKARDSKSNTDNEFLLLMLQVIGYGFIAYCNYYLVRFWMKPVFANEPIIPLGIYLFGILSLFLGRSFIYNSTEEVSKSTDKPKSRERWKIMLEELGIPIVVSLFIVLLTYKVYPSEYSLGAFLFFAFIFSFAGKGLINGFQKLLISWRLLRGKFSYWILIRKKMREHKEIIAECETEILQIQKMQYNVFTNGASAEIAQLKAELEYKIMLFNSEYRLALEAANILSGSQLKSFK